MPFTLAHPAAIVPLYKIFKDRLSLTGLIIGSIVPDTEYAVNTVTRSVISHTTKGIFYYDLPMGILIAVCYHAFIKQVFTYQLPEFFRNRLAPFAELNWFQYLKKNSITFLLSLMAGIVLHIGWDSFTHDGGYLVRRNPILTTEVISGLKINRLFWHISTIAGLYVMYRFFVSYPSVALPENKKPDKNFWPLVFLVACVIMFLHWLPFVRPQEARFIFISFFGSMALGICVICFIFRMKMISRNE